MSFQSILIANRGEIAIRIARAAADLSIRSVAVYAQDDAAALHARAADLAVELPGRGVPAYLDISAIVEAARTNGCDAIHPGYGFLSESGEFARACIAAGIAFIGPSPEALDAFGDKVRARAIAVRAGARVIEGSEGAVDLEQARAAFDSLPPGSGLMIKAVSGGGGRGMRPVRDGAELEAAFAAAGREAAGATGEAALYVERLIPKARHIEVQIAGDRTGVLSLGDRDCSLQRRRQKVIEIAPAQGISEATRRALFDAAANIAAAVRYRTVGTIEFLLDPADESFFFIEANPRLQVEHTITEEVTGVDLVQTQIRLAAGESLAALGLSSVPVARGVAVQARVALESLNDDGEAIPSGGRISAYEPPSGPGVRVDGCGYGGLLTSPAYDPLLAKVIVRGADLDQAAARAERALGEFRIEGVETNIGLLRALLQHAEVLAGGATTRFIEDNGRSLATAAKALTPEPAMPASTLAASAVAAVEPGAVVAGLQATVGVIEVSIGDLVRTGQSLMVLEAMKMEHVVAAPHDGRVAQINAVKGEVVEKGQSLLVLDAEEAGDADASEAEAVDLDAIRPDLAEVLDRWAALQDVARPDAVARRRARNQRTARENIDDLVDPGSFLEYGAFALAAQRRRRSQEELKAMSPADGLVCGVGSVNGDLFPPEKARCAALAYDFTVLAGTQGAMNHRKTDRILEVVAEQSLPLVWFAEGGGGRPGDTDGISASGLATTSFGAYAKLAGLVPKIAVVSGRCFAGNAAFVGMSEIIICTKGANLGMGGPAMIEGGGLGVYTPEQIGPMDVQTANGVVDILAEDEADATALAKRSLSYFQGPLARWTAPDQRALRRLVPENRLRVYDVRPVIETLVDEGSFLELRPGFAPGMITGFVRLEGRPMGLMANDNRYLGGAVDCEGADKASRLLALCDAFGLPVLSLIDTPGFMVGPDSEAAAAVRKTSRLFINGARLSTPMVGVVLRKAYGLGAQAMAGGSTQAPLFCTAWPTGEFGGMGLEGAVKLGYRRELEAQTDPVEHKALYDKLLGALYSAGKASNVAAMLEIDAVIDPADTRRWIVESLNGCAGWKTGGSRRFVDAW